MHRGGQAGADRQTVDPRTGTWARHPAPLAASSCHPSASVGVSASFVLASPVPVVGGSEWDRVCATGARQDIYAEVTEQ